MRQCCDTRTLLFANLSPIVFALLIILLLGCMQCPQFVVVSLASCGASQHSPDEKYFLIATNTKIPYWEAAQAGLRRGAGLLQVKAELVGPDTYDPKAQHEEFQRVLREKPTGILISAGDPKLMQADIDLAIGQDVSLMKRSATIRKAC